jgi:hypothetical protein
LKTARALAIGSCMLQRLMSWSDRTPNETRFEHITVNHVHEFPAAPPDDIARYDYQLIQVPLRLVLNDGAVSHARYDDLAAFEAAFEDSRQKLRMALGVWLTWTHSMGCSASLRIS